MTADEFTAVFDLPFKEAEAFFLDKINLPSQKWDDYKGEIHAKAFMSAGAYNADLLSDLRKIVDGAIKDGVDIGTFRKQFADLVTKRGWALNSLHPNPNSKDAVAWRSDLVWRTNINSAYQAGRWQQFTDGTTHFLRYKHADGVMNPRPQHVVWNGLVLPIDHVFWKTHYPPQGFGCHCRCYHVEDAEAAQATETTPPDGWDVRNDKGLLPGIDQGWDYNVGLAGKERHEDLIGRKMAKLAPEVAQALYDGMKGTVSNQNDKKFAEWAKSVISNTKKDGTIKTTGAMKTVWFVEPVVQKGLLKKTGKVLESTLITVTDKELLHSLHLKDLLAATGRPVGRIITLQDAARLPELVRTAKAVLYDTGENAMLYVFDVEAADKNGKWVVKMGLNNKKAGVVSNAITTGAYIPDETIKGAVNGGIYTVLSGEV